jgi:peptidoglycan/xylan/chitin deacetylase (PgdA/CDA1 family)
VWWLLAVGLGIAVLAHTAPARFVLDALEGRHAVWRMPTTDRPTIYLTYDDGPNPATTPDLLDVLAREGASATFFLIDRHITDDTVPIVRRMFADGHAVALHSADRAFLVMRPRTIARLLTRAADRIEQVAGHRPCRAFRPHAGWRSAPMYAGLRMIDYRLVGWGWMLWDWNWFRTRTADAIVPRVLARIADGDIVVLHDGDESAPLADQRHTVEATARLIPALRDRGFAFATVCSNDR